MKFILQKRLVIWEPLFNRVQPYIDIVLDGGLKDNHLKFGEALAPIAGLASKKD